jgi:hypothetical protein
VPKKDRNNPQQGGRLLAFASPARWLLTAATVALVAATAGAATAGAQHARARTPVPIDSLGPLIRAAFHADPATIEVRQGRRISIGFVREPWADSSRVVRFGRAYDVAQLLWDRYGAAAGVDTISVRTTTPSAYGSEAARIEEYFFYPEQLTDRERPRIVPTP